MSIDLIAASASSTDGPDFDKGHRVLEEIGDVSLFDFPNWETEILALLPALSPDTAVVDENGQPILTYARRAGHVVIDNLKDALASPAATCVTVAGYRLYLSGGLSTGDGATDAAAAIRNAHALPPSVLQAMGFIADHEKPLARKNGLTTGLTDTDVVDAIALGLGTQSETSGADSLTWIADVVGAVREHPGNDNGGPAAYLRRWSTRFDFDPRSDGFLSMYVDHEAGQDGRSPAPAPQHADLDCAAQQAAGVLPPGIAQAVADYLRDPRARAAGDLVNRVRVVTEIQGLLFADPEAEIDESQDSTGSEDGAAPGAGDLNAESLADSRHPVWGAVVDTAGLDAIGRAVRASDPLRAVTRLQYYSVLAALEVVGPEMTRLRDETALERFRRRVAVDSAIRASDVRARAEAERDNARDAPPCPAPRSPHELGSQPADCVVCATVDYVLNDDDPAGTEAADHTATDQ
ncbi:hypothetical protein [Amycolatopsis sp. CA-230715]|uniref:hypothetical protein n=1 Tax=Amycolatopsis sp. CA-230715 TaxID=2745196 RepID=UPI001C00E15C|nr:hypothetical protein [Amycolatopsis sp. CA-230715]